MPEVICFANMKGGVGKTTLCVNIAYQLFSKGNKVLLVDNDPQFNATTTLLSPDRYIDVILKGKVNKSIYHIYEKEPRTLGKRASKPNPQAFFVRTWYMVGRPEIRLDLICSQIELYETLKNPTQKEYLLDKFLKSHAAEYDYVLIDCPPTPSVLTTSAFAASDFAIIPVAPDYYATLGLPQFLGTLEEFKEDLQDNHDIAALGVVFTNVPRNDTTVSVEAQKRVRKLLKERDKQLYVFNSIMSEYEVYRKTLWQANPVQKIKGKGIRGKNAAIAELDLICTEFIKRVALSRAKKNK